MARRDIDRLNELEELFADLWQVPRFAAGLRRGYRPQIDVVRSEDPPAIQIVVELAGADPDRIQLVLDGRRLLIAGERPRPKGEGEVWYRSEIEYGAFERRLELAEDVDADGTRATYERGLLRIVLPIAARAPKASRVPIEVQKAS
ncbi:MAG TPA: Hsp20/alpha crystallin family protein [Gaiellaceae bacterium]|jgi:HSP20 family protein|nr:Hsp20/alpha crystallin family protein [Gaiellaceae bacterium]